MALSQNLPRSELQALGARLRQLGLNARGLEHVLGLRFPALARLDVRDWRDDEGPPAAVPALLFCGRRRLRRADVERCFGDDTAALEVLGLLELSRDTAVAPAAVVPVGSSLLVTSWDRLPDDSSVHLCGALPAAAPSWLDIGTGAAFAPLFAPGLAPAILGTDIDADGLELAELGLALSGVDHVELSPGDLFDFEPPMESPGLITFNAPLSENLDLLMARFWDRAGHLVAPGGEVLVHCRADVAIRGEIGGDVVVAQYTPDGVEAFAAVSWRPDGPNQRRQITVDLDSERPVVRRDWKSPVDSR